jgi:hypothetical protein
MTSTERDRIARLAAEDRANYAAILAAATVADDYALYPTPADMAYLAERASAHRCA